MNILFYNIQFKYMFNGYRFIWIKTKELSLKLPTEYERLVLKYQ